MQRAMSQGAISRTSCADKWPSCGDGLPSLPGAKPARSDSLVPRAETCQRAGDPSHPQPFAHFEHGSLNEGLVVVPNISFAFCTIEKNGCSEWTALLDKMLTNDMSANDANYGVVSRSDEMFGPDGKWDVFSDPAATRAVMVRDPLARFASAFLDKCTQNNCNSGGFCLPRAWKKIPEGKPVPFQVAVEFMLSQGTPESPAQLDGHWRIQSEHCELHKRVSEYTVVGMMKKDTFAQDSTCIMDLARLQRFNTRGESEGNVPFWGAAGEMTAQNVNKDAETDMDEEEVLKRLFTKDAAMKLIKHFKQDYDTFNLPVPGWVDYATGELYQDVPKDFCRSETLQKRETSDSMFDKWDIGTLFGSAGYS